MKNVYDIYFVKGEQFYHQQALFNAYLTDTYKILIFIQTKLKSSGRQFAKTRALRSQTFQVLRLSKKTRTNPTSR